MSLTACYIACNWLQFGWLTTGALQLVVGRSQERNNGVAFETSPCASVECDFSQTGIGYLETN